MTSKMEMDAIKDFLKLTEKVITNHSCVPYNLMNNFLIEDFKKKEGLIQIGENRP